MTDYINKIRVIAGVLILMVGLGNSVLADTIIKPTDAVLSDTNVDPHRPAVNTINGGGFDTSEQTALETDAIVPETWPDVDTSIHINQRSCRGGWADNTATLTLTLSSSNKYSVSGIHIWNYIEGTSRGTISFNIEVSSDNSTWTAVNSGVDYTIARGNTGAVLEGETFSFGQSYTNIQYVRINTTSASGYPGFDEIRLISGDPDAPEEPPVDISTNNIVNDCVIKPVGAVSSGTDDWQGEPIRTFDGSGFSAADQALMETYDIVPQTWPAVDTSIALHERTWRGGYTDNEATVTLTLHATEKYAVSGIHIWNYFDVGTRGVITFNIEVSSDNSTWTAVNGGADYTIARGNSGAVLRGETFDLGQTYKDIQYVRINTTSVDGYPGFDEIRLLSSATRPSPGFFFRIK